MSIESASPAGKKRRAMNVDEVNSLRMPAAGVKVSSSVLRGVLP